ncbi:MAG: Sir2 family NAD-dependent protein deacetylase, partial [Pseudomonadota bacterium]|nr:Sir2 family NAD-dependent protein deacetylase [Pseudomonadota bacterium]
LRGISTWQPRRRRDPPRQTIHVAAAAPPRPASTDYPRPRDAAKIIELHGNGTYATCLDCGLRHELEQVKQAFIADGEKTAPGCQDCGGWVKSATVSFGQSMPEAEMRRAESATRTKRRGAPM